MDTNKPDSEDEEGPSTGRVNFRLPIGVYRRMIEMGDIMGFDSVGGVGRYFCLIGMQHSIGSLLAAKSIELSTENSETSKRLAAQNQQALELFQTLLSGGPKGMFNTMGISRNSGEGEKGSVDKGKKKG